MNKITLVRSCVFGIFIITNFIFSQNSKLAVDGSQKELFKDSLKNKTFEELKELFNNSNIKSKSSTVYLKYYMKKAKRAEDILRIADGYKFLASSLKDTISLIYLDSLIDLTKNIKNKDYPGLAYLWKGRYYFRKSQNKKALQNYLVAFEYAKNNNNSFQNMAIKHNIGLLKNSTGDFKEAIKFFKENIEYVKTQDTINKYYGIYISSLFAISDSFHRSNIPDSASSYINKGIFKSLKKNDTDSYATFLLLNGVNSYMLQNYDKALDSLYKTAKLNNNSPSYSETNAIYCYQKISESLVGLNREEKAIPYLLKLDSLITKQNYSNDNRKVFELLIKYFEKKKDVPNQLKFMGKLITLDSISNRRNESLKSEIVKEFDTKLLIAERNRIIKNLKLNQNNSRFKLLILIVTVLILISFVIIYYKRQKLYKRRFEEIIKEKVKLEEPKKNEITQEELDIPSDIINDILEKLTVFEKENHFLDSSIKMSLVASKFETNSSYFSKVINVYKGKNFANYVNDLRIEYCIQKLKNDNKFRRYAIKYIGEEVGFKSVQSFSRAFYKNTGIQPSYFIKNLE